jgi:hypothetical protein
MCVDVSRVLVYQAKLVGEDGRGNTDITTRPRGEIMGSNSLTFKNWRGTGTPDLTVEWRSSSMGSRYIAGNHVTQLTITRKSDGHSGRLGMMAELNKRNRTLAWGFGEMTHVSEHESIDNHRLKMRTITVLIEVGVQNFKYEGPGVETITFIANKKSEVVIPIGVIGP